MEQRYILGDETGWLRVKKLSGVEIALPEFLKIEFIETKKDPTTNQIRDHFKILEGRERNTIASVRQKTNGQS